MTKIRRIKKVFKSKPTLEGAGVHLKRVFGFNQVPLFDPLLLLDDFRCYKKEHFIMGFPWLPLRGIETITYVLTGQIEHGDSLGNQGMIGSGDVQWMTAGSGVIHQEMPKGDKNGKVEGFQLWSNLPASRKMMDPRYRDVLGEQIPVIKQTDGTIIRVISGEVSGTRGPVRDIVTDPEYFDVILPPHSEFRYPAKQGHTVFAYVIEGQGDFCKDRNPFDYEMFGDNYFDINREPFIGNGMVVLFDDGDEIRVFTEDDGVRFLLVSGKPIGEPVAWYGPIVMNSRDELRTAFEQLEQGTFIRKQG